MQVSKWICMIGFLSTGICQAAPQQEIEHLLGFVKTTPCQYERNGTLHTGLEAVEHIQKKYDYFEDDIETAEDFIRYSATKSKMSGNKYRVLCGGQKPIYSQDWLLKELQLYRNSTMKE
mgnify:FL=1